LTGTSQYAFLWDGTFSTAATAAGYGVATAIATAAGAFTCTNAHGFYVGAPVVGASSAITNAYGLKVLNQGKSGVTNSYGIHIAAQSGSATTNIGLYNAGISTLSDWVTATTGIRAGYNNNGAAGSPHYAFAGDTNTGMYSAAADTISFSTASTQRLYLGSAGFVGIGDTSNSWMTQGLTINQGAADNEILALKSSDVAHGMTGITETDTYGVFKKVSSTSGGLTVNGYTDTGTGGALALALGGVLGEAAQTTKTTGARGIVNIDAAIKSGTGKTAAGADANLIAMGNDGTTRFIFDAEGSAHADVEWTTF
jgi:hypothetical protein